MLGSVLEGPKKVIPPSFAASAVGHCHRSMLAPLSSAFSEGALAFCAGFVSVLPTSCVRTLAATQTVSCKELVTNKQCDDAWVDQPVTTEPGSLYG
jgi:hypothetical protein